MTKDLRKQYFDTLDRIFLNERAILTYTSDCTGYREVKEQLKKDTELKEQLEGLLGIKEDELD